ncbi:hypothetical protein FIB49_07225 [Lactococcus cremoris]|uniref:Uncharacterized protein n=1 Tax=Lactococcus lactis subsp. cremoris TaxID=1359 RepID=A0AA34TK81_LACLC|nr:hypothetical protein [Lactococcus cremoris]ARE24328.1 hypothetical protein LLJM3_2152 [Lactococcus cremoris]KZK50106.1 hypothetical protein SK110_0243 [Lactococcus cremoris]MCT4420805.1 hypothetical protein [Lactococcus cremoris]MCT4423088.1 hypothetical protein [Lactococcus cremoris]MCT4425275.1 hypothetical protein [Lactococcus cremoris]
MKKTYFIKTFNLIQNLFALFANEVIANLLLHLLNYIIEKESTATFTLFIQVEKISVFLSSCLNSVEVFTFALLAVLTIFGLFVKIKDDSILNIFKSIWQTYRFRHFMVQSERTEKTIEMQKAQSINLIYNNFNKAVKKCVVDVSRDKIIIFIKVPNSQQAQKILKEMESQIREEVSSRNPDYYFSAPDRVKNSMWFIGTKR